MRWLQAANDALDSWFGRFGVAQGVVSVAWAAGLLAISGLIAGLPAADPELFDHLSQAGVGLLIAFTVAIAGVGMSGDTPEEHGDWLRFGCGFALSALVGIAACIALSSPAADPSAALSTICLAWSTAAFAWIGITVALSPVMIFHSNLPPQERSPDGGDAK